jgi:GDP-L-fucose synthase
MSESTMDRNVRIFVAGHQGMVGGALMRRLQAGGYTNMLTRTRAELDLLDQRAVHVFLPEQRPKYIFIAAARVGGIRANDTYRAEFIYQNLMIEANLIHGAHRAGVQRLMFLGSSCIYPRECPPPIKEEYLLTGQLEPTNEPYAIAKIAGIKLCESHNRQHGRQYVRHAHQPLRPQRQLRRRQQPCAAGADPQGARGQAAWRQRSGGVGHRHAASRVPLRGRSGRCMRVPDGAQYAGPLLNVGTGEDVTIQELAATVRQVVGFGGRIVFDPSKPDGTPRKLLDVGRLAALAWRARVTLEDGIRQAYADWISAR